MITESFINSCFSIVLNQKTKLKKSKGLYRDIIEILEFCEKVTTYEIPINVKSKLECLKKICNMLIDDKTINSVQDSISLTEKYKEHLPFIDVVINEEMSEQTFQDYLRQVRVRKKFVGLLQNYNDLSRVVSAVKDGSFDSLDDLVEDYESTVKSSYSNMMESQRSITIEASASLDLVTDDYVHVIDMIKRKYDRANKTPTGFKLLDETILLGGYEPSRLYVWGGGSGAGKSTILNNMIIKSATINPMSNPYMATKHVPGKITRVYIYVTMENTIEESLMRTYQSLFNKTSKELLKDIAVGKDIAKDIKDKLSPCGSTIIMKYFRGTSVSPVDLMGVVDEVIEVYGKDAIAGLYIDYLDLLKTDIKYDIYRLELGYITLCLKTIAVQYNIPVITGSQLGRKVYGIQNSKELNLDQMSESIKKVEHADFVGLLSKDKHDKTVVHGQIGKNRSGESDLNIDFTVDFSRFQFLDVNYCSNRSKDDGTESYLPNTGNECLITKFEGWGPKF
jgi:replicative DNA helicase